MSNVMVVCFSIRIMVKQIINPNILIFVSALHVPLFHYITYIILITFIISNSNNLWSYI